MKRIDPDKLAKTARIISWPASVPAAIRSSWPAAKPWASSVQSDLVPNIALGLAGGIGMQGETCGVLTSSALVLSLAVAKKEKEYPKKMVRTMECVGRMHRAFKKQCGCTDCRSLTCLDLTTPERRENLKAGVRVRKCTRYLASAAKLLADELNRVRAGTERKGANVEGRDTWLMMILSPPH